MNFIELKNEENGDTKLSLRWKIMTDGTED
jgi:hypothetical protein